MPDQNRVYHKTQNLNNRYIIFYQAIIVDNGQSIQLILNVAQGLKMEHVSFVDNINTLRCGQSCRHLIDGISNAFY